MTTETINTNAGAEFTVPLASTPSTGYVWQVQSLPEGVELLGSASEAKPGETRPGDPRTQVFRFRAGKPGTYEIGFVLKRAWEKEPVESRTVMVNVK